jgi:hypothetical protein
LKLSSSATTNPSIEICETATQIHVVKGTRKGRDEERKRKIEVQVENILVGGGGILLQNDKCFASSAHMVCMQTRYSMHL